MHDDLTPAPVSSATPRTTDHSAHATRRQLLGAGLAGAGTLVFDLSGGHRALAQQPGALRVSANVNPSTLDPATGRSGGDHQFLYPLYDTLVQWDPKTLAPRPGLARAWIYRDDTTLLLELRQGVTFHDGTPMDAEAVKFNLDRNRLDAKSNIKVDLASVESVTVTTPTTVTLKLKTADRSILLILSDRAGMMVSPSAVKAGNGAIDRTPVGAGPWKFVKWDDSAVVVYERFPNYWEKGLPKVDRLEMKIIPEVNTGVRSVMAGENDIVVQVPPIQKALLDRSTKVTVQTISTLYLHMIYLDFSKAPFNDIRVRRALNLAVDRVAFSKLTMAGLAEPATTIFPKSFWAHDASLGNILAYNPDKAKALLKEAGTPEISFTGIAYSDQAAIQKQEVLLDMWRKVGFRPKFRTASVAEASSAFFFKREVDMFVAAITPRPDPSMAPTTIFGKISPYNGGRQEIPGMEEALVASRTGATPEERKVGLSRVQRIALEQAVFVPLMFDANVSAVSKKFTGFEPNVMGRPRYERVVAVG